MQENENYFLKATQAPDDLHLVEGISSLNLYLEENEGYIFKRYLNSRFYQILQASLNKNPDSALIEEVRQFIDKTRNSENIFDRIDINTRLWGCLMEITSYNESALKQ